MPKPDVAKAAGPAPSKSNVTAKGDDHGTLWHLWNDHNVVTDIAYEINNFNPLANAWNGIETYFTGHDSYGVNQSNNQATVQLATALPKSLIMQKS